MKTDPIVSITKNVVGVIYGVSQSGDTHRLVTGTGLPPWWDFVCKSPQKVDS